MDDTHPTIKNENRKADDLTSKYFQQSRLPLSCLSSVYYASIIMSSDTVLLFFLFVLLLFLVFSLPAATSLSANRLAMGPGCMLHAEEMLQILKFSSIQ